MEQATIRRDIRLPPIDFPVILEVYLQLSTEDIQGVELPTDDEPSEKLVDIGNGGEIWVLCGYASSPMCLPFHKVWDQPRVVSALL